MGDRDRGGGQTSFDIKSGSIYINVEISTSYREKNSELGPDIFRRACWGE